MAETSSANLNVGSADAAAGGEKAPAPAPPSLGDTKIPVIGISVKWFVLVFLVVQAASAYLFMRASQMQSPGERWNSQTGVIMCELIKGVCSVMLVAREGHLKLIFEDWMEVLKSGIPALLYLVQNNLQYAGLAYLDAPTYAVLYQAKIMTTALFSVILLGKKLSLGQWFSLVALTAGVALVTLSQMQPSSQAEDKAAVSIMPGVVAILAATGFSGLAGVYFEKMLKNSQVSLWVRNTHLAIYSVIIGSIALMVGNDRDVVLEKGFFHGYTLSAWLAISDNAFGGLLIAMVIKYAGNILKNFSTAASIILTALLSNLIFGTEIAPIFIIGVALVIYAILLYSGVLGPFAAGLVARLTTPKLEIASSTVTPTMVP